MKQGILTIYWEVFKNESLPLLLGATDKGLCFAGSPGSGEGECEAIIQKRYPGASLIKQAEPLRPFITEFAEYLDGRRTEFSWQLDSSGTAFQELVWEALRHIPYGETVCYSDIANRIGKPTAVRAVGSAIGANPVLIAVPCHRVVGKDGSMTGFREGLDMKRFLLELEKKNKVATG
ncbi:cysteine methyltransferase [Neobacillus piezotolerans]|uniref:methylated-DNA--[protein]-cysteine S-methyltransferase n=1 Tax=Neobacillus piezotolerans TaxID=2259171 RepID=A0A3D8GNR0_9BACI|nr:methylated-DNA--[protein]-cysteine S-methyltransferase [Neobacillus piezotolerans]RDU35967.1 cysteine methyltransferase [Neobacillus piezotolerans]